MAGNFEQAGAAPVAAPILLFIGGNHYMKTNTAGSKGLSMILMAAGAIMTIGAPRVFR